MAEIHGLASNFFWHEIASILRNSKAGRMQIDTHNFIGEIELLKEFFDTPIEAVHAFYTMIAYWNITSTIAVNDYTDEVELVGFKGRKLSDPILGGTLQAINTHTIDIRTNHFNFSLFI